MNIKKSFFGIAALSFAAISIVGCEDDFETIGSNIIGEPGFEAELYDEAQISTANINLGPVQTNNVPVNLLGYYDHQVFGQQTSSILTRFSLSAPNPIFGEEAVLDSVVLKIPYFYKELEPTANGEKQYQLDSVVGTSPIKITVAESGFFLNQYDPESDFETDQKYYSDLEPQIEANLTGNILYQNDSFFPSNAEIVEYAPTNGELDTVAQGPAFRIKLSTEFFQKKILGKEGNIELSGNNYFMDYFRGIYIKAEKVSDEGTMMLLNLPSADAGITLYYSEANPASGEEDSEENVKTYSSYKLDLAGSVNVFEQEASFADEENLFLRGGEGSMATIDLFSGPDSDGDGVSDELEFLRENDWLINEANLSFFVDQDLMAESKEPQRLYVYDLTNNRPLVDYVFDAPGELNGLASVSNIRHSVPLERDADENGVKYKIRLTRHIHNLLNNDSTNVKLGVVVTENINMVANSAVKDSEVEQVPGGAVISPLGTVLHGPASSDEEKRLKLNIYYTASKD